MKNLSEIIGRIKTLREITEKKIPEYDFDAGRATDVNVEGLQVPFTLYDIETKLDRNENILDARVIAITVTRYGVNRAVDATAPSITIRDKFGREALSSVNIYYLTKESAQQEVDFLLANVAQDKANDELECILKEHLGAILNVAEKAVSTGEVTY